MSKLCPDCDPEYAEVCDFCVYYEHNFDETGIYIGDGWCAFHNEAREPSSGCDNFYCSNLIKIHVEK
jgi:hypothetical protein